MKRRSREEWITLIQEQSESGQSASQFCRDRGINEKYFSTVKYKLRKKPRPVEPFQAIGSLSGSQGIVLHSGSVSISLPLHIEPKWLASLIQQLGS